MKLLVVSRWFPYPPTNGAKKRAYYLIRGLAERHEVHLLSFTQQPEDINYADAVSRMCVEAKFVPWKEFRPTLANGLQALFSSRPRSSICSWNPSMAGLVKEQLDRYSFDAAIALTTSMADYLPDTGVLRILDDDNADCAYFARIAELADNPLTKFRRKLTWVKQGRHEKRLVATFDATTAVSEEDRRELARLAPDAEQRAALHVVPNGVDLELLNYRGPEVDVRSLISTGALTYGANLDAAVFFCEQILPRIRAAVPDVQMVVTGGYEGVDARPLVSAGVKLTGFVDDIRPIITRSAALVVPLRIGGGTRLKILEAMALGVPVVSTTLGAAGLGLVHEETALLADDPAEFARCAVRLMQEPRLRERLIENGRRYVSANFGWERSAEALEQVLRKLGRTYDVGCMM